MTHSTYTSFARVTVAKLSKFFCSILRGLIENWLVEFERSMCNCGCWWWHRQKCPNVYVLFIQTHYLPSCIQWPMESNDMINTRLHRSYIVMNVLRVSHPILSTYTHACVIPVHQNRQKFTPQMFSMGGREREWERATLCVCGSQIEELFYQQ